MGLKRKRLSSGLVGHWLTDTSDPATAPDHSGNLNHGTITGATWTTGTVGRALSFNGTTDYIDVGNGTSLNLTDNGFSFVLSGIPNTGYGQVNPRLISKGVIVLYIEAATGNLYLRIQNTIGEELFVTTVIPENQWSHIVATYNGSGDKKTRIYINGALSATSATALSGTLVDTSSNIVRIGGDATRFFNGTIDEVRIWNRALSAAEILDIFTKGRQRHGI